MVRDASGEGVTLNPELPMAPASTQKMLVAVAALDQLGPGFRFTTNVVARQAPHDGVADELWLVGAGDPVLAAPEWAAFQAAQPRTAGAVVTPMSSLVDALASAGIRSVTGPIHGDDSWHDRLRYLPTWKQTYITDGDAVPLSALTVNSGWRTWTPQGKPAENPTQYAASELVRLLGARGIPAGGADEGTAPQGAVVVASVSSPTLSSIVTAMLTSSDNLSAELITRELGKRVRGSGTTDAGTQVIESVAAKLGLPTAGLRMTDGSGLDVNNRTTCSLMEKTLELGSRPEFRPIWEGLAVAGRTGTLHHRLTGTPLEGRLHAKTGSISGVVGLVGFIDGPRPLQFSFMANGTIPSARALGDEVLLAIAQDQGVSYIPGSHDIIVSLARLAVVPAIALTAGHRA